MFSIMRKRGKRKQNQKRKNIKDLHNEIKDMKEKCIDYENKVKNLNEKLTSAASEKRSMYQIYQKQVFDLKEDIKLLKKSSWIGIDNYAKMKIESLEKQVEKGNSEIQELKNEVKELNFSLKARNDKVNKLKQLIDYKAETIKIFEAKIKGQRKQITSQHQMIAEQSEKLYMQSEMLKMQSKDLKSKDAFIKHWEIELKYKDVNTLDGNDDCQKETNNDKHFEGCQCFINPEGIFESDLAKKIKIEHIKPEIKSEEF